MGEDNVCIGFVVLYDEPFHQPTTVSFVWTIASSAIPYIL